LFDILSQHPEICPSKEKEPDYFIKDRGTKALNEYLALWDCKGSEKSVALESSVAYTKAPFIIGVPERISKSKLGEFHFIYMLRDPCVRIESQVRHGLFAGWGKSLDEGISDDLIAFSSYAKQLDNYLGYFPRNKIFLITLEEFKASPHQVLGRLCEFLEIDREFEFSNVEKPRNSGEFFNTSPIIARLTQGKIGRFLARKVLSPKMKNRIRNYLVKIGKRKKKTADLRRWKLNSNEREFILKELSDDLRRLESEFGIEVSKYWNITTSDKN
jgi:hypothetical protein